jgi:hypothetical protein
MSNSAIESTKIPKNSPMLKCARGGGVRKIFHAEFREKSGLNSGFSLFDAFFSVFLIFQKVISVFVLLSEYSHVLFSLCVNTNDVSRLIIQFFQHFPFFQHFQQIGFGICSVRNISKFPGGKCQALPVGRVRFYFSTLHYHSPLPLLIKGDFP